MTEPVLGSVLLTNAEVRQTDPKFSRTSANLYVKHPDFGDRWVRVPRRLIDPRDWRVFWSSKPRPPRMSLRVLRWFYESMVSAEPVRVPSPFVPSDADDNHVRFKHIGTNTGARHHSDQTKRNHATLMGPTVKPRAIAARRRFER